MTLELIKLEISDLSGNDIFKMTLLFVSFIIVIFMFVKSLTKKKR